MSLNQEESGSLGASTWQTVGLSPLLYRAPLLRTSAGQSIGTGSCKLAAVYVYTNIPGWNTAAVGCTCPPGGLG